MGSDGKYYVIGVNETCYVWVSDGGVRNRITR
jgi:hypothetical protein